MSDAKLDKILSLLSSIDDRVSKLEDAHTAQQRTIEAFILSRKFTAKNIDEACGVDPTQMRTNQLMGENSKSNEGEGLQERERRKHKQQFGASAYTAYIALYGVLMAMSFMGVFPMFEFENKLNEDFMAYSVNLLRSTLHVPVVLSGVYVFLIFGIQKLMETREPFDLKYPLACWSLFLGLFSLSGSLRTVPALFDVIAKRGVTEVICGDTRYDWVQGTPAGYWTGVFVLSKVPELIDTFFIVLRKRKLITLHWYHHITVMLFCWHAWATYSLYGIFFAAMNLTVHAFMYVFYFFAALGYRPTAYAQSITIIQILQMLFGTAITLYATVHMTFVEPQDMLGKIMSSENLAPNLNVTIGVVDTSPKCKVNPGNALAGIAMYSSYLWLFSVFFYYAYIYKRPVSKVHVNGKKSN